MKKFGLGLIALSFAFNVSALTTKDLGKINFDRGLEQAESDMYAKEYQRSLDSELRRDSMGHDVRRSERFLRRIITFTQSGAEHTRFDPETQTWIER